jgi:hypothetical protein
MQEKQPGIANTMDTYPEGGTGGKLEVALEIASSACLEE